MLGAARPIRRHASLVAPAAGHILSHSGGAFQTAHHLTGPQGQQAMPAACLSLVQHKMGPMSIILASLYGSQHYGRRPPPQRLLADGCRQRTQ